MTGGSRRDPDGWVALHPSLAEPLLRLLVPALHARVRDGAMVRPATVTALEHLQSAATVWGSDDESSVAESSSMGDEPSTVLLVAEVARRFECSPQYVTGLLRSGRIVGRRVNGVWLADERSVDDFARGRRSA